MLHHKRITLLLLPYIFLSGCSSKVDESVVEFVQETKNRKIEYKSELPKRPPVETVKFIASDLRDPFAPFVVSMAEKSPIHQENGPDLSRPREPLEAYPLDSLQMVGTIERQGSFFALLRDRSGIVHRANVGNYIGQNSGKIVKIHEKGLEIQEWIADGKGGWREQATKLSIIGPQDKTKGA